MHKDISYVLETDFYTDFKTVSTTELEQLDALSPKHQFTCSHP